MLVEAENCLSAMKSSMQLVSDSCCSVTDPDSNNFQASIMLSSSKRFRRFHLPGGGHSCINNILFSKCVNILRCVQSLFYIEYPPIFGLRVDIRGVSIVWRKLYLSIYGLAWTTRFDASNFVSYQSNFSGLSISSTTHSYDKP